MQVNKKHNFIVLKNNEDCVTILLKYKSNVGEKDIMGSDAFKIAKELGYNDILIILDKYVNGELKFEVKKQTKKGLLDFNSFSENSENIDIYF